MLFDRVLRGLSGGSKSNHRKNRRVPAFAQAIERLEERQLLAVAAPIDYDTAIPVRIENGQTVASPIDVLGVNGRVTDVNVTINLDHPYLADLAITLITPSLQRIPLASNIFTFGTTGLTDVTFDDEATSFFFDGSPGVYLPDAPLALAYGEDPNGRWQLEVTDAMGFSSDPGWITDWSLALTGGGTSVVGTFATPTPIPDRNTVIAPIVLSGLTPGEIFDVNVHLGITHTNNADLIVTLVSPIGTRVELFRNVGQQNFLNTRFDDASVKNIGGGVAPYSDAYRPAGPLGSFVGERVGEEPAETWYLEVTDGRAANEGTLNNWQLSLTTVPGHAEVRGVVWKDDNSNGVRESTILRGDAPNVVLALDVSNSTSSFFNGFDPIGDQNGDGQLDTILDAEIAGFKALVQHMIDRGLAANSTVSVVVFAQNGVTLDLNPVQPGVQYAVSPLADSDNNGIRDVDQILSSIQYGHAASNGLWTNFEGALQQAITIFTALGSATGNGNLIFLSDGMPDYGASYVDEVDQLALLNVNSRAFGMSFFADLVSLQVIDPTAEIFTNSDDLVDLLGGVTPGPNYLEAAIPGASIYLDLDENGVFDEGEPVAISDADGNYVFYAVPAGTYTVRQVPLEGWNSPQPDAGYVVTLTPGQIYPDASFGNLPILGNVTGTVFHDVNWNGERNELIDPPLANWQVYLDLNGDGILGAGEPMTVTNASGVYLLAGVVPGNYILRTIPQGAFATIAPTGGLRSITVPGGDTLTGQDFANGVSATIGGAVFEDLDGNGIWRPREPLISGVTVYLDLDGDGQFDTGEPSTVSDTRGHYRFTNLAPGTYVMRHLPKAGYSASPAHPGVFVVTVGGGESLLVFPFADTQPRAEIDVKFIRHNAKPIAGRTDFGRVAVDGGMVNRTFIIRNLGASTLRLSGLPWVSFKARRPSFIIIKAPQRFLAPGESTQIVVRFDPVSAGVHTATIVIPSNDADENPYRFTVRGVGVDGQARAHRTAASPVQQAVAKQASVFSSKRLIEDILA